MTDPTKFHQEGLTKEESALQKELIDVTYHTLIRAMSALNDRGADSQRAASLAVNGMIRGVMLFVTNVYGCDVPLEDYEALAQARQRAKDFVETIVDHVCDGAEKYHRRKLN